MPRKTINERTLRKSFRDQRPELNGCREERKEETGRQRGQYRPGQERWSLPINSENKFQYQGPTRELKVLSTGLACRRPRLNTPSHPEATSVSPAQEGEEARLQVTAEGRRLFSEWKYSNTASSAGATTLNVIL